MKILIPKKMAARLLLSVLIASIALATFGVSTIDFDNNARSENLFGLYLSVFPSSTFIIVTNFLILSYLIYRSGFYWAALLLILNPFSLANFFEAYNKFSLMTILACIASNRKSSDIKRLGAVSVVFFLHPIGLLYAALLKDFISSRVILFLSSTVLLGLGAISLAGLVEYRSLPFLDLVLSSKGISFDDLIRMQESTVGITRAGNLSIRDPNPFSLIYWKDVFLATTLPLLYFGFSSSSVGASVIGYVFFYISLYHDKAVHIFVFFGGIILIMVFNPNLGAAYRNLLPLLIGFALSGASTLSEPKKRYGITENPGRKAS